MTKLWTAGILPKRIRTGLCLIMVCLAGVQTVSALEGEYTFAQVRGLKTDGPDLEYGSNRFAYDFRGDGTAERTVGTWAIYRWELIDNILTVGEQRYMLLPYHDGEYFALQVVPSWTYHEFDENRIYHVFPRRQAADSDGSGTE